MLSIKSLNKLYNSFRFLPCSQFKYVLGYKIDAVSIKCFAKETTDLVQVGQSIIGNRPKQSDFTTE